MAKTVVGLYDDMTTARDVVRDLTQHGFNRDDISLTAYDPEGRYGKLIQSGEVGTVGEDTAAGAGMGAVLGGLSGLLAGLGAIVIPGIGPIITAGSIATVLLGTGVGAAAGAGIGAAAGALVGALVNAGIPENEARLYAEGIRRGGTLVVVQTPDNRVNEAISIMKNYNPVNVEERAAKWQEQGWRPGVFTPSNVTGPNVTAPPTPSPEPGKMSGSDYNAFDPVFRRDYQTYFGNTGYPYEHFEAAYRYGYGLAMEPTYHNRDWKEFETEARRGWEEGNTGPWDEVKDAVRRAWDQVKTTVTGKQEPVSPPMVSGKEPEPVLREGGYSTYNFTFRNHYQTNYRTRGYPYERYEPAYRYGYDVAVNPSYRNRSWSDIESEVRQHWEESHPGSWNEFRDTIYYSWNEVRKAAYGGEGVRTGVPDFNTYRDDFRRHYQSTFGTRGYSYERYEPGYRYGYSLATEPRYRNRDWSEIEPEVQRNWEERHLGPWEEFRDAIHEGWNRAKNVS